jgi:hypothetical protein
VVEDEVEVPLARSEKTLERCGGSERRIEVPGERAVSLAEHIREYFVASFVVAIDGPTSFASFLMESPSSPFLK